MAREYIEDKQVVGEDFSLTRISVGDYENCEFINCKFSSSMLSGVNFIDCKFEGCDFSMTSFASVTLNGVLFSNCKMSGVNFAEANSIMFIAEFSGCQLNYASFAEMNLKNVKTEKCALHEVDFSNATLKGFVFNDCDLLGAIFDGSDLSKSDFRRAINFDIDPARNKIAKAKFSNHGLEGLLRKYDLIIE